MIVVDIIILLLVFAGIVDIYEKFARALNAHRQLKSKDNSSNSKELDELKEEIERLKDALKSHKHAPRRRTAGE